VGIKGLKLVLEIIKRSFHKYFYYLVNRAHVWYTHLALFTKKTTVQGVNIVNGKKQEIDYASI